MSQLALEAHDDLAPSIPATYRSVRPSVETESVSNAPSEIAGAGLFNSVPIWIIKGVGHELRAKKAIRIRIRKDGDYYFAANETLAIEGTGLTASEAVEDFCTHVTHFHSYYQRFSFDQLMGEATRLKQVFADLFN
jgi:hypothetical protein